MHFLSMVYKGKPSGFVWMWKKEKSRHLLELWAICNEVPLLSRGNLFFFSSFSFRWSEKCFCHVSCSCQCYDKPRQHIKKQDITLPKKVCIVTAMFSSSHVWMSQVGEIWTIKKAEHQRIDAFESWC